MLNLKKNLLAHIDVKEAMVLLKNKQTKNREITLKIQEKHMTSTSLLICSPQFKKRTL